MTPERRAEIREQAITDVAEFCVEDVHIIRNTADMRRPSFQIDAAIMYAVAQRERVLHLEALQQSIAN